MQNGKLKDPALEAIVKAWEKKTGTLVDRENSAYLMMIFKKEKPVHERRQELLKKYVDDYKEEIEFCKNSQGTVKKLKDAGQGIENKLPGEQKAWLEALASI